MKIQHGDLIGRKTIKRIEEVGMGLRKKRCFDVRI